MEQRISLERMEEAVSLFGSFDENIRILENEFHVSVVNREEQLIITGEPEDTMLAEKAIEALLRLISRGKMWASSMCAMSSACAAAGN